MTPSLLPFLEARPEGLYAPAFEAFLDPPSAAARAIVSHAHADHAARGHGEVVATPETIALYRRRNPDWEGEGREIEYGDPFAGNGATLTLVPSGHILGGAQVFFEGEGKSVLYTGDFKRSRGRTAPPAEVRRADVLLTESTFGLPVFRFPPRSALEERLVAACREAAARDAVPVVLAYALGKSQEAAAALTEAGIPTVLHGAAWKLLPEYERAGHRFPLSRAYETGPPRPGEVLIVPPHCARTPIVQKLKSRSVVYVSGWAVRAASRTDFDADVLLPLSDHADFEELLAHICAVSPRRVITMHGYARDLARILSSRGIEAHALADVSERRSGAEDSPEADEVGA
jgi:putative mRNA 3-end processing factor